jgi:adenylate cyclase
VEERRLTAIMFSDISGYTAMMGRDEHKTIALVKKSREIQSFSIAKFQGKLIDEAGDAILACFGSASDAVHCAMEIMNTSRQDPELNLHIGIHLGEIIFEDDKVYGDGVNIAARIDSAAKAREICISEDVWKNIRNKGDIKARFIGKKNFKNVSEPVTLYKIITEEKKPLGILRRISGFLKLRSEFNNGKILITGGVILVIAIIALVFIITRQNFFQAGSGEKSVAVLPFRNDSPDKENEYFCNGVMEQIILHLQKIEGFRVPSRTSIEPFRDTKKSTSEIAGELNVAWILEGSVQKSGNHIQVNVRLVNPKTSLPAWADSYDGDISDIFKFQNEIAIQVAYALNASLSEADKKNIAPANPSSISAYDFYLQARDDHMNYWKGLGNESLDKAITLYNRSISIDSGYADAYTGLGLAYWDKHYWTSYLSENFLDSVKLLADKALRINNRLEEAWWLRSQYNYEKGDFNLASIDINHALKINPNYSLAVWFNGILKIWYDKDFADGLKILHNVIRYEHGYLLPGMLKNMGYIYFQLGMYDISEHYYLDYARISSDSSSYFYYLTEKLRYNQNYESALKYKRKLCKPNAVCLDSCFEAGWIYMMEKDYRKALNEFILYDSLTTFRQNHIHRLGYLFWVTGNKNRAVDCFNEQIIISNENIKLNRWYSTLFKEAYYDLAGTYIFMGEKEQGLNSLREFGNQKLVPAWTIELMKTDPLFESIRDSNEYQNILLRLSANLNTEKTRVLDMLKKEGFIDNFNL